MFSRLLFASGAEKSCVSIGYFGVEWRMTRHFLQSDGSTNGMEAEALFVDRYRDDGTLRAFIVDVCENYKRRRSFCAWLDGFFLYMFHATLRRFDFVHV